MESSTQSPTFAARLAGWDPAGLLYGAIVTAAVLVTAGGHSESVREVVGAWAFVLGTYWLAHVYVHAAESQFDGDRRHILHRSLVAARAEVAVLEGGIPAMVVFLAISTTDVDVSGAAKSALLFTVALLAAFGWIGARHAGRSRAASWGEAFGASLLGVVMVIAKTLLH
ncbi:MAG: hypothetical protein ABWX84_15615 [Nocardioides sp.]